MNKKLLILLGFSLVANCIFIGFETAKVLYQPEFPDIPPERPGFINRDEFRQKPDLAENKLMRNAFKAAVKHHGKEMESARQEVEDSLKAEPFDMEQFKSAMQKATNVRSAIDAAVQENMLKILSEMTPEERQAFAEKFSQKAQFKGPKNKRPHENIRPDRFPRHHRKPFHERRKDRHHRKYFPEEREDLPPPPPASFDEKDMRPQPPCPPERIKPCREHRVECSPCFKHRNCDNIPEPKEKAKKLKEKAPKQFKDDKS